MKKIVVTGGLGIIGSNLINLLQLVFYTLTKDMPNIEFFSLIKLKN